MVTPPPELEILLPIHNEGKSIERVLREIHAEVSPRVPMRFILCEDGSIDETREILAGLSPELPIKLISAIERKGYSKAVRDGMTALSAPYLLCLDSDGQCDPKDFTSFWNRRTEADIVLGWRRHRADPAWRKVLSHAFYFLWRVFFRVRVHDPSCPFLLAKKNVVRTILPEMGEMQEGFWWEFVARAHGRGFSILELPVNSRPRFAGQTQVYRWSKLPRIGFRHAVALFRIWRQTRAGRSTTTPGAQPPPPR